MANESQLHPGPDPYRGIGREAGRRPRRDGRRWVNGISRPLLGEVFGMPVVDLRRDNPEPEAVALVPEDVTRRFMVVPLRLDEQALHVAVADQPTEELRALLAQASEHSVDFVLAPESDIRWAIDSSYRAIGGVDRLVQAFEAVETARKKRDRDGGGGGRRRRRPGCPGGCPHPHSGQAGPGLGRAHRAVAGRRAGPVPHRRSPEGGARCCLPPWGSGWSAGSRSWPA